jgi:hypothetical protein
MWAFRAVGFGLIFAACTLAGMAKAGELSARTRLLRLAGEFAKEIGEEIRYSSRELDGVFAAVAQRHGGQRPQALLAEPGFLPDDRALYTAFLEGLGGTDLSGQMAHCARYASLMEAQLELARRAEAEKAKLYRMLGLCGGLSVIIFLI